MTNVINRKNHYQIIKFVSCDLFGQICGDNHPINAGSIKPACKDCDLYIKWKMEQKLKGHIQEDKAKINQWEPPYAQGLVNI